MYDVVGKRVTLQLSFPSPLHSVAMDRAKYYLFVGADSGEIYETRLFAKPESGIASRSVDCGTRAAPSFLGHRYSHPPSHVAWLQRETRHQLFTAFVNS